MAPPIESFPVHKLETSIQSTTKDLKEKSRKLPRDFSLVRDCPLYELVQWSCTTYGELEHRGLQMAKEVGESRLGSGHGIDVVAGSGSAGTVRNDATGSLQGNAGAGSECYPFVRLFRRCVDGRGEMFQVETTAWEGRKRWKESERQKQIRMQKEEQQRKMAVATNKRQTPFSI